MKELHGPTILCVLLLLLLPPKGMVSQVISIPSEDEPYLASCRNELGMHSGRVPDSSISSSSFYDEKSVGPLNSRIRIERNGGAWCPRQQISKEVYEWLQVDLGELKVVSLIETQGRFGNGQGQEYAPHYLLEYQRSDGGRWLRYRNRKGQEMFQGNTNTFTPQIREIRPPIIARRLRVVPYSNHPRTICMRVEFYGCTWNDGTLSYSMPQGDRRGNEVDLLDFTYDGMVTDGRLSGGLGQLTDWETGFYNFRLDLQDTGKKGYEWIGWRNDSAIGVVSGGGLGGGGGRSFIELLFEFDTIRRFNSVRIHSNNLFSKDVRVFGRAEVFCSAGGRYYAAASSAPFDYLRDTLIEYARFVTVPMVDCTGRYVKIRLYFDDRWIMISEVRFDSVIVDGNVTLESTPPSTLTPQLTSTQFLHSYQADLKLPPLDFADVAFDTARFSEGKVVGANRNETSGTEIEASVVEQGAPIDGSSIVTKKSLDDTYIGIIISTLAVLIILLIIVITAIVARHRRAKAMGMMSGVSGGKSPLKYLAPADHVNFNLDDSSPTRTIRGGGGGGGSVVGSFGLAGGKSNHYNPVATSENEMDEKVGRERGGVGSSLARLASLLRSEIQAEDQNSNSTAESLAVMDSRENIPIYENPLAAINKYSTLIVNLPPRPVFQSEHTPPCASSAEALECTSSDISEDAKLLARNGLFPDKVVDFSPDQLRLIEKLGEEQFGEVHLCEALLAGVYNCIENCSGDWDTSLSSTLVAVKKLRPDASEAARVDFQKEVDIMCRLRDPNVVRVLGICGPYSARGVVVEYMKFGDLTQFLRRHVPENTPIAGPNIGILSYGCLIYLATQIASGMKYLETLNMVHRDLATRNCLVGDLYTVKISDFGMSRGLYGNDYYRIEGRAAPIRWMAWESILLGKFWCKSDVWSFAITLWEILTFARNRPYDRLSDEEVIENCAHYYRDDGAEVLLSQPSNCPREIYDLMRECWNRDEVQRPTFKEIHMFLQRKNMGYDPRENLRLQPAAGNTVFQNTRNNPFL